MGGSRRGPVARKGAEDDAALAVNAVAAAGIVVRAGAGASGRAVRDEDLEGW